MIAMISAVAPPASPPAAEGTAAPQPAEVFTQALERSTRTQSVEVPTRRTRLSGQQAEAALKRAWTRLNGEPPSDKTVAILVGQWAHETGNGQSMYNFNFGGIKGVGPSGLTTSCRTREGYGATERVIRDNFRAYRNADEGAEDYLRLLQRRYGPALQEAQSGQPEQFVRALKRGGYFTGSETAYIRSVSQLSAAVLANGSDSLQPVPGPTELDAPAVPRNSASTVAHNSLPTIAHNASWSSEPYAFANVDTSEAVSILTLGLPDSVARSASRILTNQSNHDESNDLLLDQ